MHIFTVTGGAGFIGSHLADALLAAGHRVRVLDDFSTGRAENLDPRCEVLRGDVCDPHLVRRAMLGSSGCFHLAAIASVARGNEDWLGTHRINLGGTIAVLDAARALGGLPVVYASSAAVYGRVEGVADEGLPPAPLTAYGADKRGSELHAAAARWCMACRRSGLRFFNVYGPRQDPDSPYSGVISIFARTIAEPAAGDDPWRWAADAGPDLCGRRGRVPAGGMDGAAGRQGGGVRQRVQCVHGPENSVLDMARHHRRAAGVRGGDAPAPARAGDIRRSVGSPARAAASWAFAPARGCARGWRRRWSRSASATIGSRREALCHKVSPMVCEPS